MSADHPAAQKHEYRVIRQNAYGWWEIRWRENGRGPWMLLAQVDGEREANIMCAALTEAA